MDTEYGVDPGMGLECDVCGNKDDGEFYLEGGFYYCSLCNTQSQGSRHFVEEEQPFVAGSFIQPRVSVLRDKKKSQETSSQRRIKLSSWEVYNLVLKALTNKLVSMGFPQLLKDKVFQLWTMYLKRRKAIFVSQQSTVTHGEPVKNIYSIYGRQPRPIKRYGKFQEAKRKAQEEKDKAEEDNFASTTSIKRRKTIDKRKAFEKSYLEHVSVANGFNEQPRDAFDQYLDSLLSTVSSQSQSHFAKQDNNAGSTFTGQGEGQSESVPARGIPNILGENCRSTGTPRPPSKLSYSDGFQRIRKSMVEKGMLAANSKVVDFRLKSAPKRSRPFLSNKARTELEPEKFSMRSVLILLFVALRQIGAKVLLSDILRLYHEGTLYIDDVGSLLSDMDLKLIDLTCHSFIRQGFSSACYDLQEVVRSTQAFLTYMGIGNQEFPYPSYTQFISKFIEDLKLPCEFAHYLKQQNKFLSIQEIVPDLNNMHYPLLLQLSPELFILSMLILQLKMLFGLDDLTERYQSAFAKKVNGIIDQVLQENQRQGQRKAKFKMEDVEHKAEWGKLFVLEEWFSYHRHTDHLIKEERNSLFLSPYDLQPNVVSTHFIIHKFKGAHRNASQSVIDASDEVSSIFRDLPADLEREEVVNENEEEDESYSYRNRIQIPEVLPTNEPLNLPKTDAISTYLRNYPNVSHKEFHNHLGLLGKETFHKRRIDFLFEPEKYILILKKAGYDVKVLAGDARQYTEEQLQCDNKSLLLFQPFKMYDDFVGDLGQKGQTYKDGQTDSMSMNFLLNLCSSSALLGSKAEQTKSMIRVLVESMGNLFCKRCRANSMPLTFKH